MSRWAIGGYLESHAIRLFVMAGIQEATNVVLVRSEGAQSGSFLYIPTAASARANTCVHAIKEIGEAYLDEAHDNIRYERAKRTTRYHAAMTVPSRQLER